MRCEDGSDCNRGAEADWRLQNLGSSHASLHWGLLPIELRNPGSRMWIDPDPSDPLSPELPMLTSEYGGPVESSVAVGSVKDATMIGGTREFAVPGASAIALRQIADIVAEQREPAWLLRSVLEKRVLAVLAGPRGSFKSFVALDWALRTAITGFRVVLLSGEGGGLDRRVDAWIRTHAPDTPLKALAVFVLERPVNLNSCETLAELRQAIDRAGTRPDLVLIDTLSKFSPGLDENDNAEVAAYLARLAEALRDAFGCTVLLVAHSGHGDTKRPRGASALMCNSDAEYIVERPDPAGMLVTVTRERFKDTPSLPALAYQARVVDLGRCDSYGEQVTSLALEPTDAPPSKPAGKWGRNQLAAIVALKEWARAHPESSHISTPDITALLKAQSVRHQRRHEVLNSLVNARILTASIGGYTFDKAAF